MNRSLSLESHPTCIAFSPHAQDNDSQQYIAVAQGNGEIVMWTQAALRQGNDCLYMLDRTRYTVHSVAFSSRQEQQLLASGSQDNTIRLWDTHARECVGVLKGHKNDVLSVAFSPDGRLLASASIDCTVRLWDVVGRRAAAPVDVMRGHTDWVCSVSFSPDGRQLASASDDGTVRLWSVPGGVLGPVLQHAHSVFCVAFSPVVGSNMLASGCSDAIVRLWDVSGTKQQPLREMRGHFRYIASVAFSSDGSQLVSSSYDKTVRLWIVASGKLCKVLTGHSHHVICATFHPNGKQVVSCSLDKTVRVWTVCEWNDRTHQLFGDEVKRLVFCLMCAKAKLDKTGTKARGFPRLPMALWLDIMMFAVTERVL